MAAPTCSAIDAVIGLFATVKQSIGPLAVPAHTTVLLRTSASSAATRTCRSTSQQVPDNAYVAFRC